LRFYDQLYVEWATGENEYYDLRVDPKSLQNQIALLPAAAHEFYAGLLRILRQDGSPPIATIGDTKFSGRLTLGANTLLAGMADDDTGVKRVGLVVRDPLGNRYWNGAYWQPGYVQVSPEVDRPGGVCTTWSHHLSWTAWQLGGVSKVAISVRAADSDGNLSPVQPAKIYDVDIVPPETTILQPPRNTVTSSDVRIHGSSSDTNGTASIQLTLRELMTGLYWNGAGWQVPRASLELRTSVKGNWHYFLDLPPGRYGAWARGIDGAGNYDPSPATTLFDVE
jgi:hypothetical protein